MDLVVTLGGMFGNDDVAELLTTDKISELSVLTMFLMYEKKRGEESQWYNYIKELDRIGARSQQQVVSPILWDREELELLLHGSPVIKEVRQRLQSMRKEYEELDVIWTLSQKLNDLYPFDPPTQCFSFETFKQAFAAVQESVVHLRDPILPIAKRFALIPLGAPNLSWSSTSKSYFTYDPKVDAVVLRSDREYTEGDPVSCWCGPQPNQRLLINYGIVDETNPFDCITITAKIPSEDPLFAQKKIALGKAGGMSTAMEFQLKAKQPLPDGLLPFLRLAHLTDPNQVKAWEHRPKPADSSRPAVVQGVISEENEELAQAQLYGYLKARLGEYPTSIEQDQALESDPRSTPKQRVAARLVRLEKQILTHSLAQVNTTLFGEAALQSTRDSQVMVYEPLLTM